MQRTAVLRTAVWAGLIVVVTGCVSRTAETRIELPAIRFYEGKDATQTNVCTIGQLKLDEHLKVKFGAGNNSYSCNNDEAASMKLQRMPPGTIITVYDDPDCNDDDDSQKTTVVHTQPDVDIIVPSFQTDWPVASGYDATLPPFKWATTLNLDYHNGLNGKVSCVTIDMPPPRP